MGGVPYSGRKGFIDKESDSESKLGDYGARKYDDWLGRLTSIDPRWEVFRSLSPYHYSGNNPLGLKDPNGEQGQKPDKGNSQTAKMTEGVGPYGTGFNPKVFHRRLQQAKAQRQAAKAAARAKKQAAVAETRSQGATARPNGGKQEAARSDATSTQKTYTRVRNPHGSKGKPDHQAKVNELAETARKENPGMRVVTEKKMKLEGSNRRPDVQVVDKTTGKTTKVYEAERSPNSARNKKREQEYDKLGIEHETHKVGGN